MTAPLPGDFAVTSIPGTPGRLISLGERLCGDGFTQYDHALLYVGGGSGDQAIVEAQSGGVKRRVIGDWNAGYPSVEWSTGHIRLTQTQRTAIVNAAVGYVGTPYSWPDYFAIGLHHLHIPAPGLKSYIASSGHMICSQLVDQCYQDAGVHLFNDGRWPGYVMPSDLATLLEESWPP